MDEKMWLSLLSIAVTANIFIVGLFFRFMGIWKKDLEKSIENFCKQNNCEHKEIWDRVNHHGHTDSNGRVIITEK